VTTWGEFSQATPLLAERGARLLGEGVAFIATTAGDGSPRVHPFTPLIGGGRLLAFIGRHTVKHANLLRDPRYCIHGVLGEKDEEFLVIGSAQPCNNWATRMQAAVEARKIGMTSRNDTAFEFFVERVHWAVWEGLGTADIHRVAERWQAGHEP
jgi:hypothetical protein